MKELKKTYTFKLKPSVRKKLEKEAEKNNHSSSAYLDVLIKKNYEKNT